MQKHAVPERTASLTQARPPPSSLFDSYMVYIRQNSEVG